MGGRFGEMSTFMNYTFQSFNFRGRHGARPFYDLVANIAAEEFGHVELVATAINTMLTGASPASNGRAQSPLATKSPLAGVKGVGNPQHFLAGGQGALPQDSNGRPWNGDYVFSSGDLVEDLTHNFFLETGARNNKMKVYEMVDHPRRACVDRIPARQRRRPPDRLRPCDREADRRRLTKMFATPRIPTEKIPECKPHIERVDHPRLYRFSLEDYQELPAVFNGPNPETGEELVVFEEAPEGVPSRDLPPQPAVFAPDYAPEEIAEIAKIAAKLRQTAGLPKEPTGLVADLRAKTRRSTKKATSRSKSRSG
jgi:Mn-containing catalase